VKLSDLRGRKAVLYFHPKDDPPGCTKEACGFRDAHSHFAKIDAAIIGVSRDSVARHDKFKAKYDLPFALISDEAGEVCTAYGASIEKSLYGPKYMGIDRATFPIDEAGTPRAEWRKVKVPGHVEEDLQAARALRDTQPGGHCPRARAFRRAPAMV